MSATIGEPRDLCRRLGLTRVVKIPVPDKFAETTSGRRLVVINKMEDEDIPARLEAAIATVLRRHPKSVWLCASKSEATKMRELVSEWLNESGFVGHQTWILSSLGDEIERFKRASSGHLGRGAGLLRYLQHVGALPHREPVAHERTQSRRQPALRLGDERAAHRRDASRLREVSDR